MENPSVKARALSADRQALALEVLRHCRDELYLSMRFLDASLAALTPEANEQVSPLATDGGTLFFQVQGVFSLFRLDRRLLNRTYLHLLFHCLFAHVFTPLPGAAGEESDREKARLWNLATDICTEYLVDALYLPCLHKSKSGLRLGTYQLINANLSTVTAQGVYHLLLENPKLFRLERKGELEGLEREFYADDHRLWQNRPAQAKSTLANRWKDIREKMQTDMETFSKEEAKDSAPLYDSLVIENAHRYDYRDFLRKFAVLREELEIDLDSFDYIPYLYGLSLYKNMPLIEPLETREVRRIDEFVIVIDTSMSCKTEQIKGFLEETYDILSGFETFSRKLKVHILQCDERVQKDTLITDVAQLQNYMDSFEIIGRGGTDFRPAFAYVEQLQKNGVLGRLRGLLYFTDGFGTYPARKPPYDTAFLFLPTGDYTDKEVPPWAMKLILPKQWDKRKETNPL